MLYETTNGRAKAGRGGAGENKREGLRGARGGKGLKISLTQGEEGRKVGDDKSLRERCDVRARGPTFSPEFNSLTKDGLINKSITHTRGAGGMNAYRVDKDRGEDVDKIGGCPRVLVVEQQGARHGINVWPPRQNIHASSAVPATTPPYL